MVIYFNNEGYIIEAEHNVMTPTFSEDFTLEEIIQEYKKEGVRFVSLPYELNSSVVTKYKVILEQNGDFKALQPIETEVL